MTTSFGAESMARTRRYHPRVADDLAGTVKHYDGVSVELGNRFRDSVRQRFGSITDFPESYACIHQKIRAAMLSRFPYVVLFELREEVVAILGIFHAASDQTGWFERTF